MTPCSSILAAVIVADRQDAGRDREEIDVRFSRGREPGGRARRRARPMIRDPDTYRIEESPFRRRRRPRCSSTMTSVKVAPCIREATVWPRTQILVASDVAIAVRQGSMWARLYRRTPGAGVVTVTPP